MPDHSRRDVMAAAVLGGAASLTSSAAVAQGTSMHQDMSYEDVRKLLNLEPNATCGYVRVTFMSPQRIAPGGLPEPFAAGRPMGSALYFMLTPDEPVKLHRIRNDQFYHYYLGDPIEVLMLMTDGSTQHHVVGPDLRAGQTVQLFIPGQHVSHRAGRRIAPLVSRRQHGMAGRRTGRCRARQDGRARGEISERGAADPQLSAAGEGVIKAEVTTRSLNKRNARWRITMSIPCKFERSLLGHDEHEIVASTHHPAIYDAGLDDLKSLLKRLRDLRDKERTLSRGKQREARGKGARSRGDIPRDRRASLRRKQVFVSALKRVGKEIIRQDKLVARAANVESAHRALAMRRAAQFPDRPAAGYTAHEGMRSLPSQRQTHQSAAGQNRQCLAGDA